MPTRLARRWRRPKLHAAIAAATAGLALAASVPALAMAADTIPALGANDIRSDGILLPNADYAGPGDLDLLQSTGSRLYRSRVRLDCVDPARTGTYDWAGTRPGCHGVNYDALVVQLAVRGMTLLPSLMNFAETPSGYRPQPPTADGAGGTPTREQFAAFAAAAAQRYGTNGSFWGTCECPYQPVKAWEIWNEQNNGWWWAGRADAADYAAMFAATRAGLRSADPQARAVVGGLVWDRNGEASFVDPDTMIATLAATNANAFDAVAIHPYSDARAQTPEQLAAAAQTFVAAAAESVRNATGPAADGSPRQQIWVTEMGWSDTDATPDVIAEGLRRFTAGLDAGKRASENVGPVLWYMLRDSAYRGARDDQLGMRMTTASGADAGPKPVWGAFAEAASRSAALALPAALTDTGPAPPRPRKTGSATQKPGGRGGSFGSAGALVSVRAKAGKGGALALTVTCLDRTTKCSAAVRLEAKVAAFASAKRATRRTSVIGSRSVAVAGGRTKTFRIALSKAGAKALKRHGRLRVSAIVTARDARGRATVRTASATLARRGTPSAGRAA